MKNFRCPYCQLVLVFENRSCEGCGRLLGYIPEQNDLKVLTPDGQGLWQIGEDETSKYTFCENAKNAACNWLIPAGSSEQFCLCCRHNRVIPDLSVIGNLTLWHKIEFAKHRLFYTLLQLQLPLTDRRQDPRYGLAFDVLADPPQQGQKVLTGHEDGVITLSLMEADDTEREMRRNKMHEPYRTLLGHFRHEIGHYFWDCLIDRGGRKEACRALFGDDRADYSQALKRHYNEGAPMNWREHFISSYASSHPWEDFAETWAHYMHIVDTLETARSFGIEVNVEGDQQHSWHAAVTINPLGHANFNDLVAVWLPLTYALNAMNRSMGLSDIYPFILSPPVIEKLRFIHELTLSSRSVAA